MPGPTTEVLNEDLKELKREIHDRHELLRKDFHQLGVDFAGLHGELKVTLKIMNWAGALLVTTILGTGASGLWWASGLNAKIDGLEIRMEERFKVFDERFKVFDERFKAFDERFKAFDERFKAIDERSKASDARLDRIESGIIKLIEQFRPVPPSPKPEDGALRK